MSIAERSNRADLHPCPSCGRLPVSGAEVRQQHLDGEVLWLYLEENGLIRRRHCLHCQPHTGIAAISCELCGDGPMVVGMSHNASAMDAPAVRSWLETHGWREDQEQGLICGQHRLESDSAR